MSTISKTRTSSTICKNYIEMREASVNQGNQAIGKYIKLLWTMNQSFVVATIRLFFSGNLQNVSLTWRESDTLQAH